MSQRNPQAKPNSSNIATGAKNSNGMTYRGTGYGKGDAEVTRTLLEQQNERDLVSIVIVS